MNKIGTQGRRQIRKLIQVLVGRGDAPPSDSDFEILLLQLLRSASLPLPDRQVDDFDSEGFIARVDFVYRVAMLIIEADSFRHHGGREHFDLDSDKRARLMALGYRPLPITWRMMMSSPGRVQRLVADALAARTP